MNEMARRPMGNLLGGDGASLVRNRSGGRLGGNGPSVTHRDIVAIEIGQEVVSCHVTHRRFSPRLSEPVRSSRHASAKRTRSSPILAHLLAVPTKNRQEP